MTCSIWRRIESGKIELNLETLGANSVMEEVFATLSPLAKSKGLKFTCKTPKKEVLLKSDRRALSQILLNLANNAIKFTDAGAVSIELNQSDGDSGNFTEIKVNDTGRGIKPEEQSRLFQAFAQLDTVSSLRHEGTGLGLHLSQKFATLLGGRISFESEFGKGSSFSLIFKQRVPDQMMRN